MTHCRITPAPVPHSALATVPTMRAIAVYTSLSRPRTPAHLELCHQGAAHQPPPPASTQAESLEGSPFRGSVNGREVGNALSFQSGCDPPLCLLLWDQGILTLHLTSRSARGSSLHPHSSPVEGLRRCTLTSPLGHVVTASICSTGMSFWRCLIVLRLYPLFSRNSVYGVFRHVYGGDTFSCTAVLTAWPWSPSSARAQLHPLPSPPLGSGPPPSSSLISLVGPNLESPPIEFGQYWGLSWNVLRAPGGQAAPGTETSYCKVGLTAEKTGLGRPVSTRNPTKQFKFKEKEKPFGHHPGKKTGI